MQSYILSVIGIVFVSVLIEIILPNGQTAKYIKGIFSIFVVFVLINPVINFFKKDFDISRYIITDGVSVDKKLLKNLYKNQIIATEQDIVNTLEANGYSGVIVNLEYEIVEEKIKISKAKINLDKLVISSQNENINKYQFIRQVVTENFNILEEDVVFEWCGWN